jgi:cystathionine beta-lyase
LSAKSVILLKKVSLQLYTNTSATVMNYNFDEIVIRKGSYCIKHDGVKDYLGAGDLIPMWVADMDFRTPPFVMETLRRRLDHEVLGYPVRQEGYFSSLIDWTKRNHAWEVKRDWVIFSPGVVPAVNMAVLACTEPGDSIIVQPPVYFPFYTAVKDHGRKLVYNPLQLKNGRLCMDLEDLEKKAAEGAKMIIISSPHNPGGSVWTREELTKLSVICQKYNVLMISDEIHCDLVYKPNKHIPLASISEEAADLTITTVAPSKTFNLSGLSTASVIISNEALRKKFTRMLDHLHIAGGNIMGNLASESAYTHGDEWVAQLMIYLDRNLDLLSDYLAKNIPQIRMIRPEATFLVWLDCRDLRMNDEELKKFFLTRAKLGLNPGVQFNPGGEGFMRMNIGCPRAVLALALEQLANAVSEI